MQNKKLNISFLKIALLIGAVVIALPFGKIRSTTSAFLISEITAHSDPVKGGFWVPADPPLFWIEPDTTQTRVDWLSVTGATTYKVYRDITPTFSSPTNVYSGSANEFIDGGLFSNTDYYYKVTAVGPGGETPIASITPKHSGTKDIVIDDNSQSPDFNNNGTITTGGTGTWDKYATLPGVGVNVVPSVLQNAIGGDNYSTSNPALGQTLTWITTATMSGQYNVYVDYICDSSRGVARYDVFDGATQLTGSPVQIYQSRTDGSFSSPTCGSQATTSQTAQKWVQLGTFPINGNQASVRLTAQLGEPYILADAVAFQRVGDIVLPPDPPATPSPTPSPSPSVSPSPSATPSATPSPSPSVSPTPNPSVSPSPTPSPSPSPSPSPAVDIVINEVLPDPSSGVNSTMPNGEWIEFYQRTNGPAVDMKDWYVKVDSNPTKLMIEPTNSDNDLNVLDSGETTISGHGFLVTYRNGLAGFDMNLSGTHTLYLYDKNGVRYDTFTYNDPSLDKSIARIPDGFSTIVDPLPTPGRPNAATQADLQPQARIWQDSTASSSAMISVFDSTNYTSAHYVIQYKYGPVGNQLLDGLMGDLPITGLRVDKNHLYFGTCSTGGTCVPHNNIDPSSIQMTVTLTGNGIPDHTMTEQLSGSWTQ